MRKKPKKKLTPLQQNRLLKLTLLILALVIVWLVFSPATGILKVVALRQKTAQLEVQTETLSRSNEELRAEIERLRNDPEYLERIAREKYGMLKKNERVFDFSKSGPENEN